MKTPKFWQKRSITSLILYPISLIYQIAFAIKTSLYSGKKINKKVICIGNLTFGGSGKTPAAIAIGKILKEMSVDFVYLTRGYKGKAKDIMTLSCNQEYNPELTGDEPLILKEIAPTIISKNRLLGGQKIEKNPNIEAVILDDGMQNKSLFKDFTILVVDGKLGFGNNMMFPSGPLRQNISSGINEANLILLIGDGSDKIKRLLPKDKLVTAQIVVNNIDKFKNDDLLAFCGLAYPQKFFDLLKKNHLNIVKTMEFADHFSYIESDLQKILQVAQKDNLKLITTKKDWVKFPKLYQDKIEYLDIDLIFDEPQLIKRKLKKIISP